MNFTLLDWSAVIAYLLITLFLGLYFRSRSGRSVDDYFVSGRNVSWWLAGTSMVATTFAADTPLVVTGLVYAQGVAGNWIWWSFLLSGMMTVFLFARLWRRSGLLTDVQFAEMRYAGKPAAFLRGFRALYLGLLMNCLILGWVTKAMTSIVAATLGVSDQKALAICVFLYVQFTGIRNFGILGYMHHLAGSPKSTVEWCLVPLNLPLHIIGELARPVSLSLRLFGNISGEDMLLAIFATLGVSVLSFMHVPIGLPLHLPFIFLAMLTAFVQALVFTLLTTIYFSLMSHHDEEHH